MEEEGPSEVVALRLKATHETVLDATVSTFDPVGTWSDDELLGDGGNVGGAEAEVSKEVVSGHQLSAEFEIKFRAWRNHPP
jgi:hypothetical protein